MRNADMKPARQSAYPSRQNRSGGSLDRPAPGASQAMTVNASLSPSSWARHVVGPSPTYPCSSTSTGPLPTRSYAIRSPSTSTNSTLHHHPVAAGHSPAAPRIRPSTKLIADASQLLPTISEAAAPSNRLARSGLTHLG